VLLDVVATLALLALLFVTWLWAPPGGVPFIYENY